MRAGRPHEPDLAGTRPLSESMPVQVSSVQVPDTRQRPLDPEATQRLREDIKRHGLLQPIGVRAGDGSRGGPFTLVFGYHRFVAFSALARDGLTLPNIPAVIYPADTPDWQIELAEVSENLIRKELTGAERAAHTAIYAGIVEENKLAPQGKGKGRPKKIGTEGVELQRGNPEIASAVSGALGISKKAVNERIAKVARITGRKVTAGGSRGADLIAAGREALDKAHATEAAKRERIGAASAAGRKRATAKERVESEPETHGPLLATLDMWEAEHGTATVQAVVQLWWQRRHPPGRVVFNREHGGKAAA